MAVGSFCASEEAAKPQVVIQPAQGWIGLHLRELWKYRELLWLLTWRDIKGRYRQTALGWLWILIRPTISMAIFSVVFGGLAKLPSEGIPYPLFTFTAILPWMYFSVAASGAGSSLVNRMNLISKVYFPRLLPPISAVLAGLVDLAASFAVLIALMLYFGKAPTWGIVMLPLYLLIAMVTALAVGLWTATISVQFRDVRFVVETGLQVWMYATPVAYSAELIPERWVALYRMNPLYWVVEGFRWALLGTGQPPQSAMLAPTTATLLLLLSGAYVFRRTEKSIVDLH